MEQNVSDKRFILQLENPVVSFRLFVRPLNNCHEYRNPMFSDLFVIKKNETRVPNVESLLFYRLDQERSLG